MKNFINIEREEANVKVLLEEGGVYDIPKRLLFRLTSILTGSPVESRDYRIIDHFGKTQADVVNKKLLKDLNEAETNIFMLGMYFGIVSYACKKGNK